MRRFLMLRHNLGYYLCVVLENKLVMHEYNFYGTALTVHALYMQCTSALAVALVEGRGACIKCPSRG